MVVVMLSSTLWTRTSAAADIRIFENCLHFDLNDIRVAGLALFGLWIRVPSLVLPFDLRNDMLMFCFASYRSRSTMLLHPSTRRWSP